MSLVSLFYLFICIQALVIQQVFAAATFRPIPEGGICFTVTSPSDGSTDLACITYHGSVTPPPSLVLENGTVRQFGEYAQYYQWNKGYPNNNTAMQNEPIGYVRVGFTYEGPEHCIVKVDGTACCSCSSCLDSNGTTVGMKADCTNVPNGRLVERCEPVANFFPFDLGLGDTSMKECNVDEPLFLGPTHFQVEQDDSGAAMEDSSDGDGSPSSFGSVETSGVLDRGSIRGCALMSSIIIVLLTASL
ncbi:expressed unknown protein [Seminavis robusta]|uniref:Uncharacterized protein n=1 Tax=Seminavis robusta TaxID=568900 RepID=A0A9N8H1N9_9STRA|nr:expressed unknown protein [Seminavis robusta]|eukprot:Sro45_g026940.1 n/a (246) ;mRNA; f:77277-78014